jgi:hypothetical protein
VNRDVGGLVRTVVALALFAFVASETMAALKASGAWSRPGAPVAAPADPVAPIEALVAAQQPPLPAALRDPFGPGVVPVPEGGHVVVRRPVTPPPPPKPVLTAIVWDADPRALVRWKNRDWTVRAGGLFDEFQVTRITRDQVVLSRNGESIVLERKAQGD